MWILQKLSLRDYDQITSMINDYREQGFKHKRKKPSNFIYDDYGSCNSVWWKILVIYVSICIKFI